MRLKTFTAANMKDAMAKLRETLGPDAIIVNTNIDENNGPVRITAAIEHKPPVVEAMPELAPPPPSHRHQPFDGATLAAMLRYHGLPSALATRIQTAASAIEAENLAEGLAAGLETIFRFQPLTPNTPQPIMLVGPPGAGKTLTIAKLAAEAVITGRKVKLITTDTIRSGGLEQLDHFARLMKLQVATAGSPEELRSLSNTLSAQDTVTLIDTTGANAYSLEDVQSLARAVKISGAEPILVLPAGIDALEAAEMADIFASLGAKRMIATRLDAARRYAGLMTALYKAGLALAALGNAPYVANGLAPATALEVASAVIAKPDPARVAQLVKKAAL